MRGPPWYKLHLFVPLGLAKIFGFGLFFVGFLLIFCNFFFKRFTIILHFRPRRSAFLNCLFCAGAQVEKDAKKGRGQSINRVAACSICYFVGLKGYADKPLTRALRPVTPC